jgi:hypothetical protein
MYPFMSISDISFSLLIFFQSLGTALYVFVLMAQRTYSSYYSTLIWPMSTIGVCIIDLRHWFNG